MKILTKTDVLATRPFTVQKVQYEYKDQSNGHEYFRLHAPDWVNVVPVLPDRRVILIRQPRVGSMTEVLETPGGVMDPGEKDPTMAAQRELEEETGFTSQRILSLGAINPNPAIMTNLCHFFVALNCQPVIQRKHFPDHDEQITIEIVNAADLEQLVRTRQINHALSALCVMLAQKYCA
jgi:ADP-ribose pyrophosphatase